MMMCFVNPANNTHTFGIILTVHNYLCSSFPYIVFLFTFCRYSGVEWTKAASAAMLWYEKSTASIEENAVQTTEQLLMQMNRNLDYYLSDVKKATVPLA